MSIVNSQFPHNIFIFSTGALRFPKCLFSRINSCKMVKKITLHSHFGKPRMCSLYHQLKQKDKWKTRDSINLSFIYPKRLSHPYIEGKPN